MTNTASLYSRTFSQHVYDERAPRDAGGFSFALSTHQALLYLYLYLYLLSHPPRPHHTRPCLLWTIAARIKNQSKRGGRESSGLHTHRTE